MKISVVAEASVCTVRASAGSSCTKVVTWLGQ